MQAITQLLEGTIGATRTVSSGVFLHGAHRNQSEQARQAKTLDSATASHFFDVELSPARSHEATPLSPSNSRLIEIDVRIPIWSRGTPDIEHAGILAALSTRNTLKSTLRANMDTAVLALTWAGNLAQNAAAQATGIVSGRMFGQNGTDPERLPVEDDQEQNVLMSEITGRVIVSTTEA